MKLITPLIKTKLIIRVPLRYVSRNRFGDTYLFELAAAIYITNKIMIDIIYKSMIYMIYKRMTPPGPLDKCPSRTSHG